MGPAPSVVVRTAGGSPIGPVSVKIASDFPGGACNNVSVDSGAMDGRVSCPVPGSAKPGFYTMTFTCDACASGRNKVVVGVTVTPAKPATITATWGDGQVCAPGVNCRWGVTVKVADSSGKPLGGLPVTMSGKNFVSQSGTPPCSGTVKTQATGEVGCLPGAFPAVGAYPLTFTCDPVVCGAQNSATISVNVEVPKLVVVLGSSGRDFEVGKGPYAGFSVRLVGQTSEKPISGFLVKQAGTIPGCNSGTVRVNDEGLISCSLLALPAAGAYEVTYSCNGCANSVTIPLVVKAAAGGAGKTEGAVARAAGEGAELPVGSASTAKEAPVPTARLIGVNGGGGQVRPLNQAGGAPPTMQVLDAKGKPLSGVPLLVSGTIPGCSGTQKTNAGGLVYCSLPAFTKAGQYQVTFTCDSCAPGANTVTIGITAAAPPASVGVVGKASGAAVSAVAERKELPASSASASGATSVPTARLIGVNGGGGQVRPLNRAGGVPPTMQVLDAKGKAISGVSVAMSGTIPGCSGTQKTNGGGLVFCSLPAFTKAGQYQVTFTCESCAPGSNTVSIGITATAAPSGR